MPNTAEPFVLATTSMRGAGVPISFHSAGGFTRTVPDGVAAAICASCP